MMTGSISRREISSTLVMAAVTMMELQVFCWLLLYHLTYYILADRIRVLRLCLTDNVDVHQRVCHLRGGVHDLSPTE